MYGDCVYMRLQKSCYQIKCMDIVFKDVILLQNGVLHCNLGSVLFVVDNSSAVATLLWILKSNK